ncbi:Zinc finger, PHD-type [Salix suchowensis]|nr:Zinc finger, PHD-type [Salix suchowensis]
MCFKTATLKVGYPVKGPSDGKNHTFGLNMGSSITENMFGSKQYSRDKFHIKEESGTCNECATHAHVVSGIAAENEGRLDVQYCRSGADMLSPVDSSCNSRNLSTSEISHLLSACSSHDSFSENEESKDTLRESGTFEHSEMQVAVNDQQTARQNPGLSRTTLFHDSNILLKNQKPKELECFGDDALIAGDHHCYTDRKNLSSSSTSIDSFPAIENAANVRPTLCSLARSQSDTIDNNQPRTLIKFTRESSPTIAVFSNKSSLIDISSDRDFYNGTNSSKCSEEKIESPLMKAATFWVDAQINDGENHAEPEEPAKWQPTLKAQPMDLDDELDHMQDEVKVCDICGDVGQEEKLATCSKCSDGAEHIYCMREKLEKVPEGNWMCEECMLGMKIKGERKITLKKKRRMIKNSKNSGALSCKISLESNTKGIGGVYKNRRSDSSSCHFPAKRQVDDSEAFTVKRMALEKGHSSSMLSKESYPCSNAEICQGSSLIKPAYEGSLSKSKSPHGINSKVELQQSEGGVNKKNMGRVTATRGNKEEVGRMPCKSTSFKKASSDHVTAADSKVKKISSNLVQLEKMKRPGRVKGQNLAVSETTFHKSLKKSTVADDHASASIRDIRTPHGGEASALPLSTPKIMI